MPDEPLEFHVHPVPLLVVEVEAGLRPGLHLPPVRELVSQFPPLRPAPVAGKTNHLSVSPLLVEFVDPCVDVLDLCQIVDIARVGNRAVTREPT